MNNKHFFFKFKQGNSGFIEFKKLKDIYKEKIPLPIYFGAWVKKQYLNEKESIDFGNPRQREHRIHQVEQFFDLEQSDCNIYFWIFLADKIYAIKLNKPHEIFDMSEDQPTYLVKDSTTIGIPKFYYGSFKKEIDKNKLPESFANINTNQKYNRKTIKELVDNELEIAEHLIEKEEKIPISKDKMLEYLSPIQFETLIFLIFVEKGIYCSTYRGGTREKYDLTIDNDKVIFPEFKKDGILNIQIKMKIDYKPEKSDEKTIFIFLGENNEINNLFGKDWILSNIKESKYINGWLEKSLEYFSIKD